MFPGPVLHGVFRTPAGILGSNRAIPRRPPNEEMTMTSRHALLTRLALLLFVLVPMAACTATSASPPISAISPRSLVMSSSNALTV